MSLEALEQGRITNASQDGNREFLSLLACICADSTFLPPALIYKGEALQDTCFDDLQGEQAYFSTSYNGWSSNELGANWLVHVFDRHTKAKSGNRRRLLIVDGHSSHLNMKFIDLCDQRRILVLILPPHSTHRLQPLDVSLFAPLARYHTNGLNTLISTSLGYTNMCKRTFWQVFWPAWNQAFTTTNIASAWAKTGLFPLNPIVVLSIITKPTVPIVEQRIQTPITCRTTRRFHRSYQYSPTAAKTEKLLKANERLAAQHSIDQHIYRELENAFKIEKRNRRKGKKLNLLGEEACGAQFFSPGRVQAARERHATKEADKQLELDEKAEKKASALSAKLQKEAEKAKRAIEKGEKRQLAMKEKLRKATEKQACQELKSTNTHSRKAPRKLQGISILPKTSEKRNISAVLPADDVVVTKKQKVVVSTTMKGRAVLRPHRFTS